MKSLVVKYCFPAESTTAKAYERSKPRIKRWSISIANDPNLDIGERGNRKTHRTGVEDHCTTHKKCSVINIGGLVETCSNSKYNWLHEKISTLGIATIDSSWDGIVTWKNDFGCYSVRNKVAKEPRQEWKRLYRSSSVTVEKCFMVDVNHTKRITQMLSLDTTEPREDAITSNNCDDEIEYPNTNPPAVDGQKLNGVNRRR